MTEEVKKEEIKKTPKIKSKGRKALNVLYFLLLIAIGVTISNLLALYLNFNLFLNILLLVLGTMIGGIFAARVSLGGMAVNLIVSSILVILWDFVFWGIATIFYPILIIIGFFLIVFGWLLLIFGNIIGYAIGYYIFQKIEITENLKIKW